MKKLILFFVLVLFSCKPNIETDYFVSIAENDISLSEPKDGEWRKEHPEKGQSLEQYKKSKFLKPNENFNIIYLKPIGNLNTLQKKQIELTREFLTIYFQLETKVLDSISNDLIPKKARRIGFESHEQLLASYILDLLLKKKPLKKIALMGISQLDLYPKPEWNYVFGLASYVDAVGVSSIYRLQDENLTKENFNVCLSRLLKINSHEIGHMFGLHHCLHANCNMNGSNSLEETDASLARLCSECQQKLQTSISYKNTKRLKELSNFYKRNNLTEEYHLMQLDLEKF